MDVKQLFLREASAQEHLDAQTKQYPAYMGMLLMLVRQNVEFSHATRTRILAACWARRDFEIADFLLTQEAWSLLEVLKALKLLDAARQIRAFQKRLLRLDAQGSAKPQTIGQIRSSIQDLQRETLQSSLSGALIRRVCRWVRIIPPNKLLFYALSMPAEPWRELADLLHLRSDDFQLDWFLDVTFGATPPAGSIAEACLQPQFDDIQALIDTWNPPYSFLRRRFAIPLAEPQRAAVARYEDLTTLLWRYEELACPKTNALIEQRLAQGEQPDFSYAMLVERLLYFERINAPFYKALIPIAEQRLHNLELPLESPVVVLGDASGSMDVAIRVATIIGSLLAALTGAEIRFFNDQVFHPKLPPRPTPPQTTATVETAQPSVPTPATATTAKTGALQRIKGLFQRKQATVAPTITESLKKPTPPPHPHAPQGIEDVMHIVKHAAAVGATSPAAALWPSLRDKQEVRLFIVVTDEEENTQHQKMFFAEMLHTYRNKVYPARVAFVSFLRDPQKPGQMTPLLAAKGIPALCFPMHGRQPDLTKVDALLGLLASESDFFQEQASQLARDIETSGIDHVLPTPTPAQPPHKKSTPHKKTKKRRR